MRPQAIKPTKANLKVYIFKKRPEVDLSPQAQVILKQIEAAGEITRIQLLEKIAPLIETTMTASRVLSFHATGLVRCGCIEVMSLDQYGEKIESRTNECS